MGHRGALSGKIVGFFVLKHKSVRKKKLPKDWYSTDGML